MKIDSTTAKVTWDGSRIVKKDGKEIALHILAKEVIQKSFEASLVPLSHGNNNYHQRLESINDIIEINKAFATTNTLLKTKNIFTKFFAWIKDLFVQTQLEKARTSLRSFPSGSGKIYWTEEQFKNSF